MATTMINGSALSIYQRGATLLEILITILVISMPMISLAALDIYSVRSSHNALLRSQAILRVQEMAERMRANPAAVINGSYNTIGKRLVSPPQCIARRRDDKVDCSPDEIAAFDAFEWNQTNATALPSGKGTVSGPEDGGVYTITITWKERASSDSSGKAFHFQFRPLP